MDVGAALDALLGAAQSVVASVEALQAQLRGSGRDGGGAAAAGGEASLRAEARAAVIAAVEKKMAERAAAAKRPRAPAGSASPAAAADRVRAKPLLMRRIEGYLAGPGFRDTLPSLMANCRAWRVRYRAPAYWLPVLRLRQPLAAARLGPGQDPHDKLMEQGRAVAQRRIVMESNWEATLDLEIDIWDAAHGVHPYSVAGQAELRDGRVLADGLTREVGEGINVRSLAINHFPPEGGVVEVKGDLLRPKGFRWRPADNIFPPTVGTAYFAGSCRGIEARVMVICRRTGRRAALWESRAETPCNIFYLYKLRMLGYDGEIYGTQMSTVGSTPLVCGDLTMPAVSMTFNMELPEAFSDDDLLPSLRLADPPMVALVFDDTTYLDLGRFVRALLDQGGCGQG